MLKNYDLSNHKDNKITVGYESSKSLSDFLYSLYIHIFDPEFAYGIRKWVYDLIHNLHPEKLIKMNLSISDYYDPTIFSIAMLVTLPFTTKEWFSNGFENKKTVVRVSSILNIYT